MNPISKEEIVNIAFSDSIYEKGLRVYRDNKVKKASFSAKNDIFRFIVSGRPDHSVIVWRDHDGRLCCGCSCNAVDSAYTGCEHVVAALLCLKVFLDSPENNLDEKTSADEKRINYFLGYYANDGFALKTGDTYGVDFSIEIPKLLKTYDDEITVRFSTYLHGQRKYIVPSVPKFADSYRDGEDISLGKSYHFNHETDSFDERSRELLDWLCELGDVFIQSGGTGKLYDKSCVLLRRRSLLTLLKRSTDKRFSLTFGNMDFGEMEFADENPMIPLALAQKDEALELTCETDKRVVPLSSDGALLLYGDRLYHTDRVFAARFLPVFNTLFSEGEPLEIASSYKQVFVQTVLPKLTGRFALELSDSLSAQLVSLPLSAAIYMDIEDKVVTALPKFTYGEYVFTPFDAEDGDTMVVRDMPTENMILSFLSGYKFVRAQHNFACQKNAGIYEFLTNGCERLSEICELYYSERFKKIKPRGVGRFYVRLDSDKASDLLEMTIDVDGMSSEEIEGLFESFRLKKKYYRMKSGDFISLDSENVQRMGQLLSSLGIGGSNRITGNKASVKKSDAFFLGLELEGEWVSVDMDEVLQRTISLINNPSGADFKIPKLDGTLRQYQEIGFKWLGALASAFLSGIRADDMGLGKTIQMIAYIAARIIGHEVDSADVRRFLIVCPTSLTVNWLDEFERFAPDLRVCVIAGNAKLRKTAIDEAGEYSVWITSYPMMRRDYVYYQNTLFDTIVLDEAQNIKNALSQNATSVKELKSDHRFALTGTPVENSLSELWSIFDFLMPGFLGSHNQFTETFEKPVLRDETEALDILNAKVRPFILRRMKKDVLAELPDKIEEKILTEMTDGQKRVYMAYAAKVRSTYLDDSSDEDLRKDRIKLLAALTRMRQICCHPSTFVENYDGGSGKMNLLFELLSEAMDSGHRVLVFSQFTSMLDIISKELDEREIEHFYLYGATKPETRLEYVKRFNSGERSVFLISLKAGGTGLNLTGADMVIHYDPWWNPAVEAQATDRAYRIGQVKNVYDIKLITKDTIEEKIYKLQTKKQNLSDAVIRSGEVFLGNLSKDELREIFS
jgi:superfamily II DNA or RNA helicase